MDSEASASRPLSQRIEPTQSQQFFALFEFLKEDPLHLQRIVEVDDQLVLPLLLFLLPSASLQHLLLVVRIRSSFLVKVDAVANEKAAANAGDKTDC